MMELSKRIEELLEEHNFSLCGEITGIYNKKGQYDIELETYSPEGEDVIVPLIYDGTEESFIHAFTDYANDFDSENHAAMWIENRGKNGVPSSIKDLLEDAEWIKGTLVDVAERLNNLDNEQELKTYKCTISITDGENVEEQDFYVEAKSFDEAMENIKNELDI